MGFALLVLALIACSKKENDGATIEFVRDGSKKTTIAQNQLISAIPSETIRAFDPYYGREKSFRALPLRKVLELGFSKNEALENQDYILRARDGYAVPFRGSLLLEEGAYVAIEDLEVPGWEPIGPQHANPGPFYLIWKNREQMNLENHPRPWQLVTIEMASFDRLYPHTSPGVVGENSPEQKGYAIFREQCIKCHTINREGGHVGPDLNVPKSIVEYRPEAQIKAYIKNPLAFRYSNMPPHPELSDDDLDSLISYFNAMKNRKFDPDGNGAAKDGG